MEHPVPDPAAVHREEGGAEEEEEERRKRKRTAEEGELGVSEGCAVAVSHQGR